MLKEKWREKFQKGAPLFFYFLIEWIKYVKSTLVVNKLDWEQIIGYPLLRDKFVEKMENLKIKKFPDILTNCG